ncbi:MAG: magnesium/cobalt transporter CorA [Actinobacteria bacterium]|nr:magnesium/cobalt transporter CorA [Actinomycetota bacterium]
MIRAFKVADRRFVEMTSDSPADLDAALWIDLHKPTPDETAAIVQRFGAVLAENTSAGEIEATSRYLEAEDAIQLQLNFLDHTAHPLQNINAAFALRGGPLLSLHEHELIAVDLFRDRAERQPRLAEDGMSVFIGILESKVDHLADVLERTYGQLDQLSRRVLDHVEADLKSDLVALAGVEGRNGKIRLNLMDTQQVLTSFHRSDKLPAEIRDRLSNVLRDVDSLLSHTAFLLEQISFLSGTIIGLINIEQNQIVKVLSVVAAVFLPPTLIASLYGMNFRFMPELSWRLGYPLAIVLMVILGVAPYLYAKRRGWM